MSIIQKFSDMIYSQNKVRYARDETRDENDLSKKKFGKETQTTYFHYDDKNNKVANVFVRIGNKIAHFFGAKTISQDNLSNCLRHANAHFENGRKFAIHELWEGQKTLDEIESSDKFGKYLSSEKGINDKNRLDNLRKNINSTLQQQQQQVIFEKLKMALVQDIKCIKPSAKLKLTEELYQVKLDFDRDGPTIKKVNPKFANEIDSIKYKLDNGIALEKQEMTLLMTISQTTKNAVAIPLMNIALNNEIMLNSKDLPRDVVINDITPNSFTLTMYQQFNISDMEMTNNSTSAVTLVTKYKTTINYNRPEDLCESIDIIDCNLKQNFITPRDK